MSIESRKEVMMALIKEREQLQQQLAETDAVITGLRKICRHKNPDGTSALTFKGNDHNHHYYKCEICFEQIEE